MDKKTIFKMIKCDYFETKYSDVDTEKLSSLLAEMIERIEALDNWSLEHIKNDKKHKHHLRLNEKGG